MQLSDLPHRCFTPFVSNFAAKQSSTARHRALSGKHKKLCAVSEETESRERLHGRRLVLAAEITSIGTTLFLSPAAYALGFQKELKKKKIPLEDYSTLEDGIRFYDLAVGNGEIATPGQTVTVHFDVNYKSLDVVSTRSARLLGGNRSVAEPFEFVVGQPVAAVSVKKISDSANGLFSGQGGVKPPPALSTAVVGMKLGGKRIVSVPPEIGYGEKGIGEIPPNATVSMTVELLNVKK